MVKFYTYYMKYLSKSLFGGHVGRHLEFLYDESYPTHGTQGKNEKMEG